MNNFDLRKYLAEGKLLKEDMSIEDVYNDAQKQVKDIHDIDVPMNVVKQWADNYQFPYSREVDPEDEDQYILVYDFGTEERGDFMEWLKDNNLREGKLVKEDNGINYLKKAFQIYLEGGDGFNKEVGETETVKFENDGSLIPEEEFKVALQSLPTTVKVDVYNVNFKKVGDNIIGTFKIK